MPRCWVDINRSRVPEVPHTYRTTGVPQFAASHK